MPLFSAFHIFTHHDLFGLFGAWTLPKSYLTLNKFTQAVKLLTCSREIPRSNLGRVINYPDWSLPLFFSVHSEKCRDIMLHYVTSNYFNIHSNSVFAFIESFEAMQCESLSINCNWVNNIVTRNVTVDRVLDWQLDLLYTSTNYNWVSQLSNHQLCGLHSRSIHLSLSAPFSISIFLSLSILDIILLLPGPRYIAWDPTP
jgi:hypothetical protein